jgi:hypothetical protein
MVARPIIGPNTPNALPIWSGGNRSRISPKPCGIITAPKSPCTTRAMTSVSIVGVAAHTTDAATNPTMPIISIRFRPNMSPSRPPVSSPTARARV